MLQASSPATEKSLLVRSPTPQKVGTKIPLLDEALSGGIERGSSMAYWSDVEVECSSLALQTVSNRLEEGDAVIFVTTTKSPRKVVESARELGIRLERSSGQILFVDAFSALTGFQKKNTVEEEQGEGGEDLIVLSSSTDQEELLQSVGNAIRRFSRTEQQKNLVLVFDSLSSYLDRFQPISGSVGLVARLVSLLKENQATGIFVFTEWAYETSVLEKIRSSFDAIVGLAPTSQKPVYSLRVFKSSGESRTAGLVFFKVFKPGGVKVYLPKILVIGPYCAGKTSFIHSASNGAVSVNRLGTTVALDYAHVDYKGFTIDIFGTPGQTRFDPMLEKLGGQAVAIVVLISATDRPGLSRVKEQLRLVKAEGVPYVIALNKVNLRGALSVAAVRNLMRIPRKVPIVSMRARSIAEVRPGVPCRLNPEDVERTINEVIREITKREGEVASRSTVRGQRR